MYIGGKLVPIDEASFDSATESSDYVNTVKQQQNELRANLKVGLGSLPTPKNDFEIVLPESEALERDYTGNEYVEDSSEVDERNEQIKEVEGKVHIYVHTGLFFFVAAEQKWHCQSQTVQRALPRPTDVNISVLRGAPHKDQKYRELYKVRICLHRHV